MGLRGTAWLAVLLAACGGGSASDMGVDAMAADAGRDSGGTDAGDAGAPDAGADAPTCADDDSDGHGAMACGGDDCDDADATRYPGATEVCDATGHDEDCDASTLGPDVDTDTFVGTGCCNTQVGGAMLCGMDCDDTRLNVNPSATEVCNGLDDDCDGLLDGPDEDDDGDGHADDACAGSGGTDCDDTRDDVYDGATELCDGVRNDCTNAAWAGETDADGDGHLPIGAPSSCTLPTDDCDDACVDCHPGGTELCSTATGSSSRDEDCDPTTYGSVDADGDGFVSWYCRNTASDGTIHAGPDCDDARASVGPGAAEVCDHADQDCNGVVDDAAGGCPSDPSAGNVACSGSTCAVPGEQCCVTTAASTCQSDTASCLGTPVRCDGPEDCPPATVCCYYTTSPPPPGTPVAPSATCLTSCSYSGRPGFGTAAVVCHVDADCRPGAVCAAGTAATGGLPACL